jgi:ribosomal protein L3 glutamine methyltransferase
VTPSPALPQGGGRTRTVRALLAYAIRKFETAGLSYGHGTTNALDEAAWLVLHATGFPLDELNPHLDEPLPDAKYAAARRLIEERVRTRKPAAYLTNEAWLGKHRFYVDERVIVPRSYISEWFGGGVMETGVRPLFLLGGTEAVPPKRKRGLTPVSILDLCTGSGCLAILAALAFPKAKVDAADLSEDALAVARRNVADYKLGKRVRLAKSDLFSALGGRTYDLIISNPPYVKAASMRKLPEEYRKEPRMALASGGDGLDHTRAILRDAAPHLNPGGVLAVEIGHNRKALARAFPKLDFRWPATSAGPGFVFTLKREDLL